MAREPRSARRVVEVDKSSGWKPHRGSVRFHVFGQVFACLIGAVFVAEALVVERSPARDDDRMWLATGADGVGTLCLAVSSQAALIATTDTSGRVSLWDEASESIVRNIDVKDYAMSVAFTSEWPSPGDWWPCIRNHALARGARYDGASRGNTVAAGQGDGVFVGWEMPGGGERQQLSGRDLGSRQTKGEVDSQMSVAHSELGFLAGWPVSRFGRVS